MNMKTGDTGYSATHSLTGVKLLASVSLEQSPGTGVGTLRCFYVDFINLLMLSRLVEVFAFLLPIQIRKNLR